MDYRFLSRNIGYSMVLNAQLWAGTNPKNLFSGTRKQFFFISGNKMLQQQFLKTLEVRLKSLFLVLKH